jgi:hypothetical protein
MKVKEEILAKDERLKSYGYISTIFENIDEKDKKILLKIEEDYFRDNHLICPYCDEVQECEEFFPNLDEEDEYECESCGKIFRYTATITYDSNRIEEDE